jgi:uncharacterized cupin superfamily protein
MPERSRIDVDGVRDAMRARDDAPSPSPSPAPAPRLGDGPSDMAEGVSTTQIDFDGDERFQTLRRELGVSAFGINVLRLRPGQRSRIHRHRRQEEVYVVLDGTLSLAMDGEEERTLERGGVARVAPDVRRQLTNRGDGLLVVLALGGAEPHEARDGLAYERWEDEEGRPPQEVPLPPDLPR